MQRRTVTCSSWVRYGDFIECHYRITWWKFEQSCAAGQLLHWALSINCDRFDATIHNRENAVVIYRYLLKLASRDWYCALGVWIFENCQVCACYLTVPKRIHGKLDDIRIGCPNKIDDLTLYTLQVCWWYIHDGRLVSRRIYQVRKDAHGLGCYEVAYGASTHLNFLESYITWCRRNQSKTINDFNVLECVRRDT